MLSGLDGVLLHLETAAVPMHAGSLSLLTPPARPGPASRATRDLVPIDFPTLGVPWLLAAFRQLQVRGRGR